jgi:drug/metabolite transporter (DMT)-like permease
MPLSAIALVIVAAALHTGWNVVVKQAQEARQVFTWWACVMGALLFLPVFAFYPSIPARIWPYAVTSALAEAAYFITLIRAYEEGDFSLVYTLARGTAPALLTLWAIAFLNEPPALVGYVGLFILLCGLLIVGVGRFRQSRQSIYTVTSASGITAALSVALCISIYSAIDAAAVRLMSPVPYTVLALSLACLFVTPFVLARYGYRPLVNEWRARWGRIILVGVLMQLTYILVLYAYAWGRVSYVGALRELSILFATLVGWRWMGEDFGLARLIGAALVFAGVVVMALGD